MHQVPPHHQSYITPHPTPPHFNPPHLTLLHHAPPHPTSPHLTLTHPTQTPTALILLHLLCPRLMIVLMELALAPHNKVVLISSVTVLAIVALITQYHPHPTLNSNHLLPTSSILPSARVVRTRKNNATPNDAPHATQI
jgi:hypothetical protein